MWVKKMVKICENCDINEVPPYRKTLCDACAKAKKQQWEDKQIPVEKIGAQSAPVSQNNGFQQEKSTAQIKAPTGEYQSLVYNKTLSANSYEVGSAGNRFKIYFESVEDLQVKLKELKEKDKEISSDIDAIEKSLEKKLKPDMTADEIIAKFKEIGMFV